jgi:hypothetical protein
MFLILMYPLTLTLSLTQGRGKQRNKEQILPDHPLEPETSSGQAEGIKR